MLAELDGLQVQEPSPRAKEVFGLVDIETAALAAAARPDMARFARLVATTVGLLLVIGCLAVGMQLLMQAEARRDEFAMCLALGASRARMAVGVVCEGAMLALSGAALAVPLGWWLLGGLRALQLPGRVNVDTLEMAPDRWTMAIAIAAAVGEQSSSRSSRPASRFRPKSPMRSGPAPAQHRASDAGELVLRSSSLRLPSRSCCSWARDSLPGA